MTEDQLRLATFITDCIKIVGALIVFGIGLQRYLKAQKWKRGEFIAAQIKEFEADSKVQLCMAMLDWNDRKLCFQSDDCEKPRLIQVSDALLAGALLPHQAAKGYYPDEMAIRDCIDRYLDMLMRLQTFVDARLIKIDELGPYISYWIELAAGQMSGHHDADVFVLLLNYIKEYGFAGADGSKGAAKLIRAFGYDPVPARDAIKNAISNALRNRPTPKDQTMLP
jgi:hypothetical protein